MQVISKWNTIIVLTVIHIMKLRVIKIREKGKKSQKGHEDLCEQWAMS